MRPDRSAPRLSRHADLYGTGFLTARGHVTAIACDGARHGIYLRRSAEEETDMVSDTKWDRVPYFERPGGEGRDQGRAAGGGSMWDRAPYLGRPGGGTGAERRRTALVPRPGCSRLAGERKQRGLTQAQLAEAMGVTPEFVAQLERGEVSAIDALARYVQVLGGRLDLVASFGDATLTVATVDEA